MNSQSSSTNLGAVVSVRGSVVDIRFEKYLPPIYSLLHAGTDGRIAIEVLSQLYAHRVRGAVVEDAIERLPQTGDKGIYLKQQLKDKLIEHKQYINKHGQDMPEIRDWRWKGSTV